MRGGPRIVALMPRRAAIISFQLMGSPPRYFMCVCECVWVWVCVGGGDSAVMIIVMDVW